ncbi:MAG: flagellar hook-basal body complex protein FliE [Actinomycetota bacterium]|nr:flagellar hook-basal body complex protein FliE [Actinomycetota bacterium]
MSIAPLGPVGPLSGVGGLDAAGPVGAAGSSEAFGSKLVQGLEEVQALHGKANDMAVQAATGDLTDVHDYMIAASKASTATQLTVALRNKALEAFSEIMRMPV